MGVRRAVEMALDAANQHPGPIYTYGPLIHNPQAVSILQEKGIDVLEDIPDSGDGIVLIRAHGVPPQVKTRLADAGFTVIDATCPRVIKVQAIIDKFTAADHNAIIIGDRNHPEVVGLLGYAHKKGIAVDRLENLESLPDFEKAVIVAQTTQSTLLFAQVKEWAAKHHPHYRIYDTICGSTERRQAEVSRLAQATDAVVVVGGHHSGNTRRLFGIAEKSGKPAQHVETEAEIDISALESARTVGITAGASTPNWVIKRVSAALEDLLSQKTHRWRHTLFHAQQILMLSNIYVALGAGSLCYACARLKGYDGYYSHVIISILYVLSMHMINHLIGTRADRYNDPQRANFFRRHKIVLATLAICAGGIGLITAYTLGVRHFLALFVMSALGLSYKIRLLPAMTGKSKFGRIKDIPGSKTILIALAWGVVTTLLPALSMPGQMDIGTLVLFVWSTGMVFARTSFFDVLDMQGDRIVGRTTIPLLVGEKQAMRMLNGVLLFCLLLLVCSSLTGLFSGLGYLLAVCPLLMALVLAGHRRGAAIPGLRLEFVIESHFVLVGLLAFVWTMMG